MLSKLTLSVIVGLCLFLGNISGQAKSFKIVNHISAEHTHSRDHHHHHDTQNHEHEHDENNSKDHTHHHHVELSFISIQLALPSLNDFISHSSSSFLFIQDFTSTSSLSLLSFSSSIFRPPIA